METFIVNGLPYGPTSTISVGGSPFSWTNPEAVRVMVVMGTLGAVSLVQVASPVDGTLMDCGAVSGFYLLNPGWRIRVTYVVTPPQMSYTPA